MSHRPLAIPFCASALVLGSVLVPLGLFPGAFNRRAAGVLVSPELPPGYYPMDKSRGVEPAFICEREMPYGGWAKSAPQEFIFDTVFCKNLICCAAKL